MKRRLLPVETLTAPVLPGLMKETVLSASLLARVTVFVPVVLIDSRRSVLPSAERSWNVSDVADALLPRMMVPELPSALSRPSLASELAVTATCWMVVVPE